MTIPQQPKLPPPPPIAGRFVRYLLGFGVSVAVGLAPFLGKLEVPLFEPLLAILPPDERDVAVPLSAALMGMVAVAVQWYGFHHLNRRKLRRVFPRTLLVTLMTLLVFFVVNAFVVLRVPTANQQTAILLVGFQRGACPGCHGLADVECVKTISFDPGRIESCWGTSQIRAARIALTLSYLATTVMFGALVGLLVVGTSEPKAAGS